MFVCIGNPDQTRHLETHHTKKGMGTLVLPVQNSLEITRCLAATGVLVHCSKNNVNGQMMRPNRVTISTGQACLLGYAKHVDYDQWARFSRPATKRHFHQTGQQFIERPQSPVPFIRSNFSAEQ